MVIKRTFRVRQSLLGTVALSSVVIYVRRTAIARLELPNHGYPRKSSRLCDVRRLQTVVFATSAVRIVFGYDAPSSRYSNPGQT
ncbi:hypothetical protein D8S78_08895 [Natrialba swarupiae]|nr:hypothetical protein [Natrialba swarupiae]